MITSQTYQNALVCLSDKSEFGNCHFERCGLQWADGNYDHPVFFNCSFTQCDLGLPLSKFADRLTMNSLIVCKGGEYIHPRQKAIDEANRTRIRREPLLAKDIASGTAGIFELEGWCETTRAEYRKIMASCNDC